MPLSGALADSRIFEAKTNVPGVTIEEAYRNGEELAVVGRGDDSTLFRIESPSTPVGCANRIEFVTSTGERVEEVADMCVLNWSLVVEVDRDQAPAPPAGDPDTDAPDLSETVSVVTEPPVTILTVSLDGEPVSIAGRDGNAVQFEVVGGESGIVCEREVGVTLSDGRTFSRNRNICLDDWSVVINLEGGDDDVAATEPPPPPPPPEPIPTQPGGTSDLPTPDQPLPGPIAGLEWMFSTNGDQAGLVHANVATEASNFLATCTRGSDAIRVRLMDAEVANLATGAPVPITFQAESFSRTYAGVGSEPSPATGLPLPELEVPVSDPLWTAVIGERELQVSTGSTWGTVISLEGSAEPARQLIAACSSAPVAPQGPQAPPAAGGPGIVASYFCDNGSAITVTFNGALATATVVQTGAPPVSLSFEPGGRNARYSGAAGVLVVRDDSEVRWNRSNVAATVCRAR